MKKKSSKKKKNSCKKKKTAAKRRKTAAKRRKTAAKRRKAAFQKLRIFQKHCFQCKEDSCEERRVLDRIILHGNECKVNGD
jgi:hypothetical protein